MVSVLSDLQASLADDLAQLAAASANLSSGDTYLTAVQILKRYHIEAAIAGRQDATNNPIRGALSAILNLIAPLRDGLDKNLTTQLQYMAGFIAEIAGGALSEAQIAARFDMYANAVSGTYWDANRDTHDAMGDSEERRILNPAEHCDDCLAAAGHWEPVGTLPSIGESQCLSNCQCEFEYR
jgi:hypothetical protein